MSAWVEVAEAYSLVMRAQRKLEDARRAVMGKAEYNDPAITDIDGCWNKVSGAADELRYHIGHADG